MSRLGLRVVAVEHAAEHSEHSSFFTTRATSARRGRDDAIGKSRERQCLQNDSDWAGQSNEEQSLAAEQCRLYSGDGLDVVVDRRLKRDEAPGVDIQRLARRQVHRDKRAGGMQEHEAIAHELLENETFAAEEAG